MLCFPEGGAVALFLAEGGSIGRPLNILSISFSNNLRRSIVMRNLPLLRDLYWVPHSECRKIRDIAFRWNAFKPRSYVEFADSMPNEAGRGLYGGRFRGIF